MAAPVTSFKKFLRKQAPVTLITLPHKTHKSTTVKESIPANSGNVDMSNGGLTDAMTEGYRVVSVDHHGQTFKSKLHKTKKEADDYHWKMITADRKQPEHKRNRSIEVVKEEVEQLDELAKTPMTSTKTDDLASRLAKYYNVDKKDQEGVQIFQKFHNHINNAYTKAAKGPEDKSKPDPVDHESEKVQGDALAAGKKIDALLSAHKAPTHDFHVYAGLKHHPFETIKDEQGYEAGDGPVEAHIPGFAQASIDPNYAKQNAGKAGHVLKMQIKAGSRHGAYVGHVNGDGHDKEFLMRPGRKLRVHPEPEMHGDVSIWHGELSGDK